MTYPRRANWVHRRLLAIVLALPTGAGAATIDYAAIDNPQAIDLADRSAEARWQALFEVSPVWVSRQIAYLTERLTEQWPTLIAARLLYRGEPWTRRNGDQVNLRRWHVADVETKLALLRELRALRDPLLGDTLKHFLSLETDPTLASSALATLWFLDPAAAPDFAVRLADPTLPGKLPGSVMPAVRQDALRFLFGLPLGEQPGVERAETRRALEWALLHARGGERNHALSLLRRGQASDLLRAAILRFDAERAKGEIDDDGSAGLAIACARLGSEIDPELARALVAIAVGGDREIAAPAATALASNLTWTATVPTSEIAKRVALETDPVIRHALLNLLLRVNTNAGAIDNRPDSPWNALSAHRERLSRWEWEQYVK